MSKKYKLYIPGTPSSEIPAMTYNEARRELSDCKNNWDAQIKEILSKYPYTKEGLIARSGDEELQRLLRLRYEARIVRI